MNEIELNELVFNKLKDVFKRNKYDRAKILIFDLVKTIVENSKSDSRPLTNDSALNLFLSSKKVEGCSSKSIVFYRSVLIKMFRSIDKIYYLITTENIRKYLSDYSEASGASNVTIDNNRRIISAFFSWAENEEYIIKSPARRIHKVRSTKIVKEVFSEETIELMKQNAGSLRDVAIIEFLYSTGIRVGEIIKLNIENIDFENRESVVKGKGNKERRVYFDAKTKVHLQQYIDSREDDNPALFVSRNRPSCRLQISGIEIMIRKIGKRIGIKAHPHKFRRSLATKAIDKGMPIEQVQRLLGHSKIDSTLEYAMVEDNNVKLSHKKYLE